VRRRRRERGSIVLSQYGSLSLSVCLFHPTYITPHTHTHTHHPTPPLSTIQVDYPLATLTLLPLTYVSFLLSPIHSSLSHHTHIPHFPTTTHALLHTHTHTSHHYHTLYLPHSSSHPLIRSPLHHHHNTVSQAYSSLSHSPHRSP